MRRRIGVGIWLASVWLTASVDGSFLGPALGSRSRVVPRFPAACACEPPSLGGRPLEFGDGLLVNDDASGAWWRASVKATRENEVMVHYTGCDPAWDEWFDVSSDKIVRMDAVEQKIANNAFQSDTVYDDIDDEELLEQMRQQKWNENARWQLNVFAQEQLGSWDGDVELYEARETDGSALKQVAMEERSACVIKVSDTNTIAVADTLPGGASSLALTQTMGFEAFRPEVGNMAVAAAYSFSDYPRGDGCFIELAIGEAGRRVRAKLQYTPGAEGPEGSMAVSTVAIVREARDGVVFAAGDAAGDVEVAPGRGLYDPPPGDKLGYLSLYSEGGVTLVFPTVVPPGTAGVISLDWIAVRHRPSHAHAITSSNPSPIAAPAAAATISCPHAMPPHPPHPVQGKMRYQLDRKFKSLDGSLSSLELTEIQKSDAEVIAPDFPHQSGGQ